MNTISKTEITAFQEKIHSWYAKNKRDLPWRNLPFNSKLKQRDPYKILVSEVMSQQTQLSRVVPKYEAWIKRFPTVEELAGAPTRDVLLYWSGLGYNRRALNLQKSATIIHTKGGVWPRTYNKLISLPGIGKYTANALLCFAFNEQIAVVDTNVRKVMLYEILHTPNEKVADEVITEIAQVLLPMGKAYEWNQALMDYAAVTLKDKKIQIKKQSPFRQSNRYYRGWIMKLLVKENMLEIPRLLQYFKTDNPITYEKLMSIIIQMEHDGLLKQQGQSIVIV